MTQPNIQKSEYKEETESEIIGKKAYDLASSHIHNNDDFIVSSSDPELLGSIGLVIEQHLDTVPPKLKPIFQQMLEDIIMRKENLKNLRLL